jgi:hypothetical protein
MQSGRPNMPAGRQTGLIITYEALKKCPKHYLFIGIQVRYMCCLFRPANLWRERPVRLQINIKCLLLIYHPHYEVR